jgi:hypothetical protein
MPTQCKTRKARTYTTQLSEESKSTHKPNELLALVSQLSAVCCLLFFWCAVDPCSQANLRDVEALPLVDFHLEEENVGVEMELKLLIRVVDAPDCTIQTKPMQLSPHKQQQLGRSGVRQ